MLVGSNVKTYLIAGHTDLTEEEFAEHYSRPIKFSNAYDPDCKYIVGDKAGCDQFAQTLLRYIGVCPTRITIFNRVGQESENKYNYAIKSFLTDEESERMMTNLSTHDILWCRDDKGWPARALNRRRELYKRRLNKGK